ncbi:hypothetical protein QUA00_13925 [Microcoleus sp. T2B6]|uniref:hypothetical protein n=1 Tax=Microcoleus sp. T2B6 TaxID=3055424 RepID=UPI002FD266A4
MSDCVLFPASLSKNRAWSVWADRESYLSLVEGTCTLISPRVQPCGWKRYVRTFTVIHVSTNRTYSSSMPERLIFSGASDRDNSVFFITAKDCTIG